MDVAEYINKKIEFQDLFLNYLDEENDEDNYDLLINFLKTYKITEKKDETRRLFHFINIITSNHYRSTYFFNKIEKIIAFFIDEEVMKKLFSNLEVIELFWSNKRILLFLYEKQVIHFDANDLYQRWIDSNIKNIHILVYLYPEIKLIVDDEIMFEKLSEFLPRTMEDFDKKRKNGENDSYICSLIRNDLVVEFIKYVNKESIQTSTMKIKPSIFETNSLLLKYKEPTLIEYAAYFGSIQIYQYLRLNNAKLEPSIWLYAIHGRNAELIHLLEEDHILPPNNSFALCLEESLKCHHNEISEYLIENHLVDTNFNNLKKERKNYYGFLREDKYIIENVVECCLYSNNYFYFMRCLDNEFLFDFLCKYDYVYLVKLFLRENKENIEKIIIIMNYFINYEI